MNKSSDDQELSQIWQTQKTISANSEVVVKAAKSQRFKQRLYIALDIFSLSPYLILYKFIMNFDKWVQLFMFVLFLSTICMVFFLVRLRWLSAFTSMNNTYNYVATLKKQYKNNALIAKINKHSAWIAAILGFVLMYFIQAGKGLSLADSFNKILLVSLFYLAFFIPWFVWSNKREQRFLKEYKALDDVYPEH